MYITEAETKGRYSVDDIIINFLEWNVLKFGSKIFSEISSRESCQP